MGEALLALGGAAARKKYRELVGGRLLNESPRQALARPALAPHVIGGRSKRYRQYLLSVIHCPVF